MGTSPKLRFRSAIDQAQSVVLEFVGHGGVHLPHPGQDGMGLLPMALNQQPLDHEQEIVELENENGQLLRRAEKKGTIGNMFVQRNELVPPYKTLFTVYDLNPTLIKAFVQEQGVQNLRIGARVMVESINRKYEIEGQIIEIGSRVTAYPDKINPLTNQKSYGQEIFVNIPNDNDFLNGEKVFVYIVEDEK